MRKNVKFLTAFMLLLAVLGGTFMTGCEEQPVGYIFEPSQRDMANLARAVAVLVDAVYEHTDEAAAYLDRASLTDDYGSLLIGGWQDIQVMDTLTNSPYMLYYRSYLDQEHYFLRFDREPDANAVRTPSSLDFTYAKIRSFQNPRTSEFYGDVSENRLALIEYADNRQDPYNVDGWFNLRNILIVEEEIETAGAGTYTYNRNVPIESKVDIRDFSINPDDQQGRLIFLGHMPIWDEAGEYHGTQVSGDITINADGTGTGELQLYGEPVVRLNFTGRTYGFSGYFTLFNEDHDTRYELE